MPNESENADLFWAHDGSGPRFFGVVRVSSTALQRARRRLMKATCLSERGAREVLRWISHDTTVAAKQHAALVSCAATVRPFRADGTESPLRSWPTARRKRGRRMGRSRDCPVPWQGRVARRFDIVTELDGLLQGAEDLPYIRKARSYAADNSANGSADVALLPGMAKSPRRLPPGAVAHMMWMLWGPAAAPPIHVILDGVRSLYCASTASRGMRPPAEAQAGVGHRAHARIGESADGIQWRRKPRS